MSRPDGGHGIAVAVFDAYGTLLDVHSAMAAHADRLGPEWRRLSAEWRAKQTEYTWIRSLSGAAQHRDFGALTEESLRFVMAREGRQDEALIGDLLAAYRALAPFPEVPTMLAALRDKGIARAILSNGEPAMLDAGVRAAGISDLLDDVLSVEAVRIYKPHPSVYQLAVDRFAVTPARIAFFSSNPWDAFGAACFGFRVFWINRLGQPEEYGLRGRATELPDLTAAFDHLTAPHPSAR